MSGGLLQRICKTDQAEVDVESKQKEQRQIVRGILAHNDDFLEFLDSRTDERVFIEVSVETVNELKELDCFDSRSIDGQRAIGWANRHSDSVEVFIEVVDSDEEFSVELEYVGATTVTNDMISDFADRFHRSIASTFDPLAEDHEEPQLVVRPW